MPTPEPIAVANGKKYTIWTEMGFVIFFKGHGVQLHQSHMEQIRMLWNAEVIIFSKDRYQIGSHMYTTVLCKLEGIIIIKKNILNFYWYLKTIDN